MSKLEDVMKKRADDKAAADRAARKAEAEAEEKKRQDHIAYYKREFNKRFSELKELVDGEWDKWGWGWKFKYKDREYWISYEHYHIEAYGVDDYDIDGYHWVLKPHFNASDANTITLNAEKDTDPLTEKVLTGLEALADPNRRMR